MKRKQRVQPDYAVAGGSVQGASHRQSGALNQDCFGTSRHDKPVEVVAAAVSDGHGSALHPRSDYGSHAAVASACSVLCDVAGQELPAGNAAAMFSEIVRTRVPSAIHSDWLRRVGAHLQENPLCPFETSEAGNAGQERLKERPVLAYGTTLLSAALGPQYGTLARIGDGAVRMVGRSGTVTKPFTEDDNQASELTDSLCDDAAARKIETRFLNYERGKPACIALATDGYSKSFASSELLDEAVLGLYRHITTYGLYDFERALQDTLIHTTQNGTGDDVTVGLLVLRELLPKNPSPNAHGGFLFRP